jgi:hypothetical protein
MVFFVSIYNSGSPCCNNNSLTLYFKQINDKWHFIENIMLYKKERANLKFLNQIKDIFPDTIE